MIKEHFTDGLISLAILLSLFRTDLTGINDIINYPEVQDIILGQTVAYLPTSFHHSPQTLINSRKHIDFDNDAFNAWFHNVNNLPLFREQSQNHIEAFLVSAGLPPEVVTEQFQAAQAANAQPTPVTEETSDVRNSTSSPTLPLESANSFTGNPGNVSHINLSEVTTNQDLSNETTSLVVNVSLTVNNPFPGCNLTTEDLELIDVLWRQDVDLGCGKEAFDQNLRLELEKEKQLEAVKQQEKVRAQRLATEKEERERQELANKWLKENFMRDGETGEWVRLQNVTLGNISDAGLLPLSQESQPDDWTLEQALDYISANGGQEFVQPEVLESPTHGVEVLMHSFIADPLVVSQEQASPTPVYAPQQSYGHQDSLEENWTGLVDYLNMTVSPSTLDNAAPPANNAAPPLLNSELTAAQGPFLLASQLNGTDNPQFVDVEGSQFAGSQVDQSQYANQVDQSQYANQVDQSQYANQVNQSQYANHVDQSQYANHVDQSQYASPVDQSQYASPVDQSQYASPVDQSPYGSQVDQSQFLLQNATMPAGVDNTSDLNVLTNVVTNLTSDLTTPTSEEPVMDWGSLSLFNNLTTLPEPASGDLDLVSSIFLNMSAEVLPQASDQIDLGEDMDTLQMLGEELNNSMASSSPPQEITDVFDGLEGATGGLELSHGDLDLSHDDLNLSDHNLDLSEHNLSEHNLDLSDGHTYSKMSRLSESSSDSGMGQAFSSPDSSPPTSSAASPASSHGGNRTASNHTEHDPRGSQAIVLPHIAHNHTYNTPPGQVPREVKKYAHKEPSRKGPQSRDVKRANELKIPFTVAEIINSPVETFNEMITKHKLTEPQLALIRDIRRRGKNKVAAQNCRKRKVGVIVTLADEMDNLHKMRDRLVAERAQMERETRRMRDKFSQMYANIFQSLRNDQGQPYDPNLYSLQQSSDGNVFLVPRNLDNNRNRNSTGSTASGSSTRSSTKDAPAEGSGSRKRKAFDQ